MVECISQSAQFILLKSIDYNFTGVQALGAIIVYCDSAVSYGPKLKDHTHQVASRIDYLYHMTMLVKLRPFEPLLGEMLDVAG